MTLSDRRNWQALLVVLAVAGGLAAAWLAGVEQSDANIRVTIRQTGRAAFALYLVVLVARPLQQLLRRDGTVALLRNRRLVGVAFAAMMTVHLGLIIHRFGSQPGLDFPPPNFVGYGAYAIFYLMLITSFEAPKRAIGPRAWKILHRTGLVWAAVVFVAPRALADFADPAYLSYFAPFMLAVLIRFTSWRRSRRPGS